MPVRRVYRILVYGFDLLMLKQHARQAAEWARAYGAKSDSGTKPDAGPLGTPRSFRALGLSVLVRILRIIK